MANNIIVAIKADVADLTAKTAIARADMLATGRTLTDLAREAQAAGEVTAEMKAALLEAGEAAAASKVKYEQLNSQLKAARASTDELVPAQMKASGAGRVLSMQLSQVGQQALAGGNILQALAIQLPDIAVGMSMAGAEAGTMAGILGGPWGIAATTAISLGLALAPSLFGVGDEADKAAPKVDRLTASIQRLHAASGNITPAELGDAKLKLAKLRGQRQQLDDALAEPNTHGRAGLQARNRLGAQKDELDSQIAELEATVAGSEKAYKNQLRLKALGKEDKPARSGGSHRSRSDAERQAEKDQREAERAAKEKAQQDRQIATDNTQTTLSVQRVDIGDRRAAINADFAAEKIGADAKAELLKKLAQEEAADETAAMEAKKAAYAGDVVAVQQAANQQKIIAANLEADIHAIDRQRTADLQREADRRQQIEERAARDRADAARDANAQILDAEGMLVSSILSGRQSLGQAVLSVGARLVEQEIAQDIRYLTEKQLLNAQGLAADQAASRAGLLLHLLGETRKTTATVAGEGSRTAAKIGGTAVESAQLAIGTGAHVSAEAVKTGATAVGQSARVAATAAGASASAAITSTHNMKEVISHAATAAAGAYHAMAAIPVVGPFLGAAAAATTFAAVTAFGALASFDVGVDKLPRDMVAKVHTGERIMPARDNDRVIALMQRGVEGGGQGNSRGSRGDVHAHYSPTINAPRQASMADMLRTGHNDMVAWIKRAQRNGAFD